MKVVHNKSGRRRFDLSQNNGNREIIVTSSSRELVNLTLLPSGKR